MLDFKPFLRRTVHVAYQDDDLLVLNKPEGCLSDSVFQAPYDPSGEYFSFPVQKPNKLYLLHRLDRDTSGLLLLAFQPKVASEMKQLFKNHSIQKTYIALLSGVVSPGQGILKDRLEGSPKINAISKYKVTQVYREIPASLVELKPETGKTNQLRIQTANRHWPILGDRKFGHFQQNKEVARSYSLKRMFLHASRLEFIHPTQKKKIQLNAPLPSDLEVCLDSIRGGS